VRTELLVLDHAQVGIHEETLAFAGVLTTTTLDLCRRAGDLRAPAQLDEGVHIGAASSLLMSRSGP